MVVQYSPFLYSWNVNCKVGATTEATREKILLDLSNFGIDRNYRFFQV